MLDRVLTSRTLRLFPVAALVLLVIGLTYFIATSSTGGEARLGGDFPAFYAAGRIVRTGSASRLYEPSLQRQNQMDLLPQNETGRIHFSYPPAVAAAFVPLTLLSYKTAYVIYTLAMAVCCVMALRWLAGPLSGVGAEFVPALAATLTFYPLFRAVVGGQNTALSLLCAAAAANRIAKGNEFSAGLWLGSWTFKPQLALPVIAVLAVRSRAPVKMLSGVAVWIGLYYVIGAAIAGPGWPVWWWREGIMPFAIDDLMVDRDNSVSFRELAYHAGAPLVGWIASGLAAALALGVARRENANPSAVAGTATATAVLVAPHALYYDGGLAVLPMTAAAHVFGRRLVPAVALVWLLGWTQLLRPHLPFPPVTAILLLALLLCAAAARSREARGSLRSEPDARLADREPASCLSST